MTAGPGINNWQDVQAEVLAHIHSRRWKPGDLIPNEADLAKEFGCARATVNRALRAIAETGLLERRRKAGTRVALHPVRKATLSIPVIRKEIEQGGQVYSYELIDRRFRLPPQSVRLSMRLEEKAEALHLHALHSADGRPYVWEDRWVNTAVVPEILSVELAVESANEWLVANAPFTDGDFIFSATRASAREEKFLKTESGDALFVIERLTWDNERAITWVRLTFAPGYSMRTSL